MIGGRIRAGVAALLAVCLALGPGLETLAATGTDQRPAYQHRAYGWGVSDQRPTYERQHASVAASPRVGTDQRPTYERPTYGGPTYGLHSPLGGAVAGRLFRNAGTNHFVVGNNQKPAREQLSDGLGLSASLSLGVSARKEESGRSSETVRPTTITAGGDVTLDAERVSLVGSQVNALENVTLTASELLIKAEATRRASWDRSRSWGASVGVGIDIGKGKPSAGVQLSGYLNRSRLDSDGVFHVNSSVQAGRHLAALIDGDMTLRGGNLIADTAKIDVGGDLTVASVQNSNEVDGKSSGFNASVTISSKGVPTGGSLGVHGARESGWRSWADRPSSIETLGALDIDVGDTTAVEGALINSQTGDLDLNTGRLVLSNLHDSDVYDYKSGGFNVSVGEGGWNASVNFDIIEQDKQGITRATIGAGDITIRDVSKDEADALVALANRDPSKFQQVLRDEYHRTIGALDLKALYDLPKNIQTITNALRAFAAPIPAHVEGMGDEAKHLFRKLIFDGLSEEQAFKLSQSKEFAENVRLADSIKAALAQVGGDATNLDKDILRALMIGHARLISEVDPAAGLRVAIQCGLFQSECEISLEQLNKFLDTDAGKHYVDRLIATSEKRLGEFLATDGERPYNSAVNSAINQSFVDVLFYCRTEEHLPLLANLYNQNPEKFRALTYATHYQHRHDPAQVIAALDSYNYLQDPEKFNTALDNAAYPNPDFSALKTLFGIAVDFTPIVGDIKGFYECGDAPSLASCVGTIVGIVPLVGDVGKLFIKNGDEIIEVIVKKSDDGVDIVSTNKTDINLANADKGGKGVKGAPNRAVISRADFDAQYGGRFASRAEADAAYDSYNLTKNSNVDIVLGRQPDTKAGGELGMTYLDNPNWTVNVNDAFIQGGIDAGKPFYLGSNANISNYRSAWDALKGNRGDYPQTVFFREMKQLRDAGYRLDGDYMRPPN